MNKIKLITLLLFAQSISLFAQENSFRAPSYPLITHDPYFSIWSPDEVPTRSETMHCLSGNINGLYSKGAFEHRFSLFIYECFLPDSNMTSRSVHSIFLQPAQP